MSSDKWVKARLSWARRSHLELFQKLAKTVERLDAIVRRMLADTSHNSAFSISAECEHLWTINPCAWKSCRPFWGCMTYQLAVCRRTCVFECLDLKSGSAPRSKNDVKRLRL